MDPDAGESFFKAETIEGPHGALTITADGAWTYAVDNDLPAVQGLGKDDVLTDTVTVTSADGTPQDIEVTITGTNDVPFISGDLTSTVTEDVSVDVDGDLVASGQLAIVDPDAGESFFKAETIEGPHGSLTITADGAWTYDVDNDLPAVQELGEGQSLTDTVTVTSMDGTEQAITITINGNGVEDIVGTPGDEFLISSNNLGGQDGNTCLLYTSPSPRDS